MWNEKSKLTGKYGVLLSYFCENDRIRRIGPFEVLSQKYDIPQKSTLYVHILEQ